MVANTATIINYLENLILNYVNNLPQIHVSINSIHMCTMYKSHDDTHSLIVFLRTCNNKDATIVKFYSRKLSREKTFVDR